LTIINVLTLDAGAWVAAAATAEPAPPPCSCASAPFRNTVIGPAGLDSLHVSTATGTALPPELADVTRGDGALRRFLHGLPGVDQVGVEQRAATLATRSIKKQSKLWAIDTLIGMVDLTTLEGADTHGRVRSLCAKARRPDPERPDVPPVAAVCVYPDLVATAAGVLSGTRINVASVATAFPSGRSALPIKLADTELAVASGATEVDMVIDRGAFLSGRYGEVFDEIVAVKQHCGGAHLKVILETGELSTYDNVRRASWLALLAGADFIKTSTGKVSPGGHPPGHPHHAAGRARLA
jgi:deoxyribose-phosphate aldolase